ncbi:MAG: hypothetical protein FWG64_11090 [Firmicutes bacterium]|nr:hypothetical protein [Bacillota bacterium]
MSTLKFKLISIPIFGIFEVAAIVALVFVAITIVSPAYEDAIAHAYVLDNALNVITRAIATIPFVIYGFIHLLLFLYSAGGHKILTKIFFTIFFLAFTFVGVFALLLFLSTIDATAIELFLDDTTGVFGQVIDTFPIIQDHDPNLANLISIHVVATILATVANIAFSILAIKLFGTKTDEEQMDNIH